MKLKYIFSALFVCLGLAVACDDEDPYVLEELQVSKSYVAIPMSGGSETITVKSGSAWAFDESLVPDWLTISPMNGNQGETKVTFSAPETKVGRNGEVKIKVAGKEQYINVIQGLKEAENSTCAQIIAGEDGRLYRVTGTVTSIVQTTYGNWYLQDETGSVYIYGTLDKNGQKENFSSLGLEVGDIVTVEGPKTTFNGTIELVNVTVIKIVKSLLKIIPSEITLEKEESSFEVKAAVKSGCTMDWELEPENDWLHVTSTKTVDDTVYISLHAEANTAVVPRSTEVNFSATNGSQTTNQTLTVNQGANAPDVTSIAEGLKTTYAHVKGTVTAITKQGYVLTDESASALVYYGSSYDKDYAIGDQIELIGTPGAFNFGPQFGTPIDLDEKIGSGEYTYPTPALVTKEFAEDILAQIKGQDKNTQVLKVQYVQAYGTVVKSGSYTNITFDGIPTSLAQGSPYQLPADITLEADAKIKLCGYLVSVSGNKYLNIAITSIEPWDGGDIVAPKTLYGNTFSEDPSSEWTIDNKVMEGGLTYVWSFNSNGYMKASGYKGSANASEGWLISPEIDATSESKVVLTFDHAAKFYGAPTSDCTLWAQKDGGAWTQVTIPEYPDGSSWDFISVKVDLSAYAGGKLKIAFKYTSSAEAAGTWEVKNVVVKNYE